MPWFSSHIHCLLKFNVKHIIFFHILLKDWHNSYCSQANKYIFFPEKDSAALSSLHLIPLQCTGEAGTSEDANTIFIFFQSELRQTISNLEKTYHQLPPDTTEDSPRMRTKSRRVCNRRPPNGADTQYLLWN